MVLLLTTFGLCYGKSHMLASHAQAYLPTAMTPSLPMDMSKCSPALPWYVYSAYIQPLMTGS